MLPKESIRRNSATLTVRRKSRDRTYLSEHRDGFWYELKKDSVTQAYAEDIWRSLTLHIFPDLGTTPISAINAPQVINLLRPLETKGSLETVKRLTQRLNEIMTYGVNSGLIHANPLAASAPSSRNRKRKTCRHYPRWLKELMVAIANASIKEQPAA